MQKGRFWASTVRWSSKGRPHLESVLQVLGFQALPRGQLRVHAGGESGNTFLLLRDFLLRSKGVKTFSLHVGESFSF